MHFKQQIALKYAELVYYGLWFTPLREALDGFVNQTQKDITGTVTLKLYKGNISVAGRESEFSLYRTDLSSFTMGESYDQKDAAGVIRILGLPARSRARIRQEVTKGKCGPAASGSHLVRTLRNGSGRFPLTWNFCS